MTNLWIKLKGFLEHPTLVVAFCQTVIAAAIAQGLFSLSAAGVGVVMAVITAASGLISAALTHQPVMVWIINLGKAVSAVIVGYDSGLGAAKTAAVIGFICLILGYVEHSKATPKIRATKVAA